MSSSPSANEGELSRRSTKGAHEGEWKWPCLLRLRRYEGERRWHKRWCVFAFGERRRTKVREMRKKVFKSNL